MAGNTSWLNRGCEAIERSVTSLLLETIPDALISVLPFGTGDTRESACQAVDRLEPPTWQVRRGSAEWIRRNLLKRYHIGAGRLAYATAYDPVRELLQADASLIQIGGDNFTLDYGRPDAFFALNDLARKAGRPVVLWGASIGPFSGDPAYERYAARQLHKSDLLLVRERLSVEYLATIGVRENVRFAMDPAFMLETLRPSEDFSELLNDRPIALNVSPLFARFGHLSSREFMDEVQALIKMIVKTLDCPVVLVPHVLLPGQNDAQLNQDICEAVSDLGSMLRVLPGSLGAREIKWCVSQCRAVVAARTHLTIAGFSTGVPTLSLGYSTKARGINLEVYGHDGHLVDIAEFGAQKVFGALVLLLEDEAGIRRSLLDNGVAFRESARSAGVDFARFITPAGVTS